MDDTKQGTHYFCTSCRGVANHAKNCETHGCDLSGKELKSCNCTDGNHGSQEKLPQQKTVERND